VDARTIAHVLGHSDLETTLRYLRRASQETKDHGDKLEAAFARAQTCQGCEGWQEIVNAPHVVRNGSVMNLWTSRLPILKGTDAESEEAQEHANSNSLALYA
jgi:hypothetical protein